MIKHILNKIRYKINGVSNETLLLQANIREGLKVGRNVYGLEGCTIDHGHCWLIEVGHNVVFAPQVYLLAHDTSAKRSLGYVRIGKIRIGDNCFIGARAMIMPNVEIGENTIVGANSVVTKSFPANVVIAGNPAKIITTVKENEEKLRRQFEQSPQFDHSYTLTGAISQDKKREMTDKMANGIGFVK